MRCHPVDERSGIRPGKTLVMFALLLPVLLGIVGLAVDCGLVMAAQRVAQNSADAAAMAAAMAELAQQGQPRDAAADVLGATSGGATATLAGFNNPPQAGPHAGDSRYYEVAVSYPVTTLFMPAVGGARSQQVHARAVAGSEASPATAALTALDPTASPGLAVSDTANLVADGRIAVNTLASPAATVASGQATAPDYRIVGHRVSGSFVLSQGSTGQLALDQAPVPDALLRLPTPATTPSVANDTASPLPASWSTQLLGSPVVQASQATGLVAPNQVDQYGTVQLYPGVYQSITIRGGTVNLNPGVYILRPTSPLTYALDVTGGTVTGVGVMFYNTGGDYVPATGYPDSGDTSRYDPGPAGNNTPPATTSFQANFGGIRIDSSSSAGITLSGLRGDGDPFRGMLIYQRRANSQGISLVGGHLSLAGTVYAKWAPLAVSGGGTFSVQLIGGSVQVSGGGTLTLSGGAAIVRAPRVFLVE